MDFSHITLPFPLSRWSLRWSAPLQPWLPRTLSWVGLGLMLPGILNPTPVQARTADTAPAAVTQDLAALDRAASAENLDEVLQYYDRNFLHGDGWTRSDIKQSLESLWDRFDGLRYTTELLSWDELNGQVITETRTQIQGTEVTGKRTLALDSELHLKQYWSGNKIVREEVLAEQSLLSSGDAPPTLVVNLPPTVQVNSSFNFDVIVMEPLGDDLLLGGILDEPVREETFIDPSQMDLEPILAGGLFKVGRAPAVRDTRWISAVIVRKGGMTFVTQRLQVVE